MTITEVLDELGIHYFRPGERRAVRAGWVGVPCVYCGHGPHDAYLGFPTDGRTASCWSCGSHPLGRVLKELSGREWKEVIPLLDRLGATAPRDVETVRGQFREPGCLSARPCPAHEKYLAKRGVDRAVLERLWHVRYLGVAGRLSWRLYIPIFYMGSAVSWTTRAVGAHPHRYVSASPGEETVSHKKLLYGHDLVANACVVVEGPADAWSIGPGAVATMGTAVTPAQVAKLAKIPVRAIAFDNEPAAQQRARDLARKLEAVPGTTEVVRLETGADPAECDRAEIDELRKHYLGD